MVSVPLVSVIVPIYKVENYLDECVDSIRNQSYTNLEIILVDDGSPDNCPAICDNYAKLDNRIRVIHKQNGGLSSARNAGMDNATGEYVIFVDSDDLISYNTIKDVVNFSILENADIVSYGLERFSQKPYFKKGSLSINNIEVCQSSDLLKDILSQKDNCSSCTRFYKRKIIGNLRFFEGRNNEDVLFLFYLLSKPIQIVRVNTIYYYYRINQESISSNGRDFKDIILNNIEMAKVNKERELGLDDIIIDRCDFFYTAIAYAIWRKGWQKSMADVYYDCNMYIRRNILRILFKSNLSLRHRLNSMIIFSLNVLK